MLKRVNSRGTSHVERDNSFQIVGVRKLKDLLQNSNRLVQFSLQHQSAVLYVCSMSNMFITLVQFSYRDVNKCLHQRIHLLGTGNWYFSEFSSVLLPWYELGFSALMLSVGQSSVKNRLSNNQKKENLQYVEVRKDNRPVKNKTNKY